MIVEKNSCSRNFRELLATPNNSRPVSITNLTKGKHDERVRCPILYFLILAFSVCQLDGDTAPLSKYSKSTHRSATPEKKRKQRDEDERASANKWFAKEEKAAIQAYILDRELEILIILEGIDTTTGEYNNNPRIIGICF